MIAKVKIPEEYKVVKNGEKRFEMCKAFEDYRLEGKIEGKIEGRLEGERDGMRKHLVQAVCKKLQKNKSVETIAEELEEEIVEVEKIVVAQKKVGSYDMETIFKALVEYKVTGLRVKEVAREHRIKDVNWSFIRVYFFILADIYTPCLPN